MRGVSREPRKKSWQGNQQSSNEPRIHPFTRPSLLSYRCVSFSLVGNERYDSPRLLRVASLKNFVDALSKRRNQIKIKKGDKRVHQQTLRFGAIPGEEKGTMREKFVSRAIRLVSRHPISNDAVIDFATSYPNQLAAQEKRQKRDGRGRCGTWGSFIAHEGRFFSCVTRARVGLGNFYQRHSPCKIFKLILQPGYVCDSLSVNDLSGETTTRRREYRFNDIRIC